MAASQCGHVEVVRELLRGGANLEVKLKSTNWTALMLAALNNQVRREIFLPKYSTANFPCWYVPGCRYLRWKFCCRVELARRDVT